MAKSEQAEAVMVVEAEPRIERDEFTASQRCMLTREEILEQGERMAGAMRDANQAENELASVKKQFQSKIDTATCAANAAANLIRDKFEYRPVKCERILDYDKGTVSEMRMDTLEVFSRREMTEGEKQLRLKLDAAEKK